MADAAKKVPAWMQGKQLKANKSVKQATRDVVAEAEAAKAAAVVPVVAPKLAPAKAAAQPIASVSVAAPAVVAAKPKAPPKLLTPPKDEIVYKREPYVSDIATSHALSKYYMKTLKDASGAYVLDEAGNKVYPLKLLGEYEDNQEKDETDNPYLTDVQIYMPETRKAFNKFIYDSYRKTFTLPVPGPPNREACADLFKSSGSAGVEAFLYQKFIREYIRQASPYRGVLVYHGLGSGKTCSSIAAAEALYGVAQKKVIVMTPSSLRGNFLNEISFCGFRHYQLQNFWVPFKVEKKERGKSGEEVYMRTVLSLGDNFMKRFMQRPDNRRIMWLPDFSKKPEEYNYTKLTPEQQFDIRAQVTETINQRIKFVNYNGVTAKQLKKWACSRDFNGNGMFDNSVIVIDEIHNLTRLMQGSIVPYMIARPGKMRKVPVEPVEPGPWYPKICGLEYIEFTVNTVDEKLVKEISQIISLHSRTTNLRAEKVSNGTKYKISALPQGQAKQFDETGKLVAIIEDKDAQEDLMTIFKELYADIAKKGITISEPRLNDDSTTNYKRSFLLYRLISGARNSKIIGLSGTPIINFPEELGILANLLAGYIECVEFNVNFISEEIIKAFDVAIDKLSRTDIIRKKKTGNTYSYVVSIFPSGYVKHFEGEKFVGIKQQTDAQESLKEVFELIKAEAMKLGLTIGDKVNYKAYPRLPIDEETFRGVSGKFIDAASLQIKNEKVLKKRLTGIISYYKGSKEEYMPRVIEDKVINCHMSDYVLEKYTEARRAEIDVEAKKKEGDKGDIFADVEMYAKKKNPSSYRFRSRAICNFAFPKSIDRPFPDDELIVDTEVGTANEELNDVVEVAYQSNEADETNTVVEQALEAGGEDEIDDENDAAVIAAEDAAIEGPEEEEGGAAAAGIAAKAATTIGEAATGLYETLSEAASESFAVVSAAAGATPMRMMSYQERVAAAMTTLDAQRDAFLKVDGELKTYSPKLYEMIKKINASEGSNLVYSQFKTVEGLGVLGIALKANGYKEIKLTEDTYGGGISLSAESIESIKKGPGAEKRFISFTGEGGRNLRNAVLNIFNGRFENLPPSISEVFASASKNPVTGKSYTDTLNKYGDICWVIGITGAGAEGISLKCVRGVHIYEPYWNMVRLDQVKGRAIRICSHADLPYDERTVRIYTYVSLFAPAQLSGGGSGARVDSTLQVTDRGETSDQKVLNVSMRKQEINTKLLTLMKEVAVDCELNKTENDADIQCFSIMGESTQYMFDPDLDTDILITESELREERPSVASAVATAGLPERRAEEGMITYKVFAVGDKKYLIKPSSKPDQFDVYDETDRAFTEVLGILGKNPANDKYFWIKKPEA
jgi:hypothetical protein